MLEILEFIFASGWRFAGFTMLIVIILAIFRDAVESICRAIRRTP